MSVYEVPEAQWVRFCERFARDHHGQRVTLELTDDPDDPAAEREVVIDHRPLEHLAVADPNGEEQRVVISTNGMAGGHARLVLPEPARLRMEQHGERRGGLLRIDSISDRTLLVRFDEPLFPGLLDRLP